MGKFDQGPREHTVRLPFCRGWGKRHPAQAAPPPLLPWSPGCPADSRTHRDRGWRAEEGLERTLCPQVLTRASRSWGTDVGGSPLPPHGTAPTRAPPSPMPAPTSRQQITLPLELSSSSFGIHLLLFVPLWDVSQTVCRPGSCPRPCLPGQGWPSAWPPLSATLVHHRCPGLSAPLCASGSPPPRHPCKHTPSTRDPAPLSWAQRPSLPLLPVQVISSL